MVFCARVRKASLLSGSAFSAVHSGLVTTAPSSAECAGLDVRDCELGLGLPCGHVRWQWLTARTTATTQTRPRIRHGLQHRRASPNRRGSRTESDLPSSSPRARPTHCDAHSAGPIRGPVRLDSPSIVLYCTARGARSRPEPGQTWGQRTPARVARHASPSDGRYRWPNGPGPMG